MFKGIGNGLVDNSGTVPLEIGSPGAGLTIERNNCKTDRTHGFFECSSAGPGYTSRREGKARFELLQRALSHLTGRLFADSSVLLDCGGLDM